MAMAMQGRGNARNMLLVLAPALLLATLILLQARVEAKNYDVGGAKNWDYPDVADMGFYDKWASQQTFLPGDSLTFSYPAAQHDTTIVTAAEYTGCVMSTGKKYTSGTDVVALPKAGTYYFYCSVMGHCEMGMKMKVVVGGAAVTPVTAPVLAPAVAPVLPPVLAPAAVPVAAPAPAPVAVPVAGPAPSPAGLAPAPIVAAPDVAPSPGAAVGPAAAPAPDDSSASSAGVGGFLLLFAAVGATTLFMF